MDQGNETGPSSFVFEKDPKRSGVRPGVLSHSAKLRSVFGQNHMGMGQNPIPLVNIKIAGIYGCSSP